MSLVAIPATDLALLLRASTEYALTRRSYLPSSIRACLEAAVPNLPAAERLSFLAWLRGRLAEPVPRDEPVAHRSLLDALEKLS